jgi:hypothetical protein
MDAAERFQELLDAYADQRATAEELVELQALLTDSPARRKALVDRAMMDVSIRKVLQVLPAESAARARPRRIRWVAAAAAALVLLSLALYLNRSVSAPTIATGPTPTPSPSNLAPSRPLPPPHTEIDAKRDAALWPFSSASPWNMPIGSGALYAAINGPAAAAGMPLTFDSKAGVSVHIARADLPSQKFFIGGKTAQLLGEFRIPADALADSKTGMPGLLVIDEHHEFAYELIPARRQPDGFNAPTFIKEDLRGSGIGAPLQSYGKRSFGGTSIGGLLRRNELRSGIRHALALAVPAAMLNAPGTNQSSVWPATNVARKIAFGSVGNAGNLRLGSLVALPPDIDIDKLGLNEPALALARALQDYGAYVISHVGTANQKIAICAEAAIDSEAGAIVPDQLAAIARQLKIVTNNSADNVGGPGKPRRPLAPELAQGAEGVDF